MNDSKAACSSIGSTDLVQTQWRSSRGDFFTIAEGWWGTMYLRVLNNFVEVPNKAHQLCMWKAAFKDVFWSVLFSIFQKYIDMRIWVYRVFTHFCSLEEEEGCEYKQEGSELPGINICKNFSPCTVTSTYIEICYLFLLYNLKTLLLSSGSLNYTLNFFSLCNKSIARGHLFSDCLKRPAYLTKYKPTISNAPIETFQHMSSNKL